MNHSKAFHIIALASSLLFAPGYSDAKYRQLTTSTGKQLAARSPESGIKRFAEIRPGLARGGNPGPQGMEYLREKGYKTIVSFLVDPAESTLVAQHGMKFVHIPIRSSSFWAERPTEGQVRQFLAVAKDSTNYPMFFHCKAGKDRTGAFSAIYRIEACGWTNDEAVEEMKAFGFAWQYRKLKKFVRSYAVAPASTAARTTAIPDVTPAARATADEAFAATVTPRPTLAPAR